MPYVEQRGAKFRVKWWAGDYLPSGAKKFETESGFNSYEEAEDFGLDRESDIRNQRGIKKSDGALLMSDYLRSWPDTLDVGHLRERNVRSYIRLYIEPQWGAMSVGEIKPSMYKSWEKRLRAMPNIGHRYAGEILRVFAMLMDDAVDDGLRAASPVKRQTRRGRYVKKTRERKRSMRIEDVHQLALNAGVFWGFPGYVYVLTMACTGMRPAEAYALRREYCHPLWPASDPRIDPDEEERYEEDMERYGGADGMSAVRVEWQHQRETGKLGLHPPKYGSRRTLVIPRFLAELLALLLDSHDSEWVFPSINGGVLADANFSFHYWRPIADGRKASVPRQEGAGRGGCWRPLPEIPAVPGWAGKRQYLTRHGHKEWLDEDGHSRVAVERRMGHELPGVEGVYSNVSPEMERAIMKALQARWDRFVVALKPGWLPEFPTPSPVDLVEWMNQQVRAAQAGMQVTGS